MARDAATYRGARRNACIREHGMVWGPNWSYKHHNIDAHKTRHAERHVRKVATTSGGVHEAIRRGDYALAIKRYFRGQEQRTRATGLGRGD